eukprot:5939267-Pleurochrysis_carterae.AAC.1
MAWHVRLARKCVLTLSFIGGGMPASRRAMLCGCRSVAATVRLATSRRESLSPLLCRPNLLRCYFVLSVRGRPGGPGEISVYASGGSTGFGVG